MKTATTELRLLIESGEFERCDLYTITLVDGTIVYVTDADTDQTWDGHTFLSDRPVIKRETIKSSLGMEVDGLSLTIHPRNEASDGHVADTLAGLPFGKAIREGVLDGAKILLEKAYLASWSSGIVGVLHGFEGSVSEIDGGRGEYQIEVKSALELLNIEMPRNLFQSTCVHFLYNSGCTLNRAAFTSTGEVSGSITVNGFDTNLAQVVGYFDRGVVVFTSGVCSGLRRTVKKHTAGGFLTFALPLPQTPSVGDDFTIYPTCDRMPTTCDDKFDNLDHFKGYPFVPTPETAY